MTTQRSFKRLVRARMAKTGESYLAARSALLTAGDRPGRARPVLATTDEAIRLRTGLGWERWFDLLDESGAQASSHREIARWVADQLGIDPLVWEAQAITVSYERARGLRAVGQRDDGFAVTAQKTVAVSAGRLFDAFVEGSQRERWLPDAELSERTATKPKVAHFDWAGGESRVHVTFLTRGEAKSTAAVEHARVATAQDAERLKAYWRRALNALKTQLEGGGDGA